MVFTCCVSGCYNSNKDYKMHRFPYLDKEVFNIWLHRIGNEKLKEMRPEQVYRNFRVCHNHFSEYCIIVGRNNSMLKARSLPTVGLPGFHEVPTASNSYLTWDEETVIESHPELSQEIEVPECSMGVCRVCLGDSDLTNIFGTEEEIAQSIVLFASVQVVEGDGLPQYICKLCKIELDICMSFKKKCESSFNTLQESFNERTIGLNKGEVISAIEQDEIEVKTEIVHEAADKESFKKMSNNDCRQCNLHFPSDNTFNIHMEKKHRHICNICYLHFECRKTLTQHLKNDHDVVIRVEKSKQCHICGKRFQYNAELVRHTLMHSGIKQFKCSQCDKYFSSKGGLNKHIAKHSGIQKFACPICSKMFIHQSNLHDHKKVHLNERRHVCDICSKAFKTRRTLLLHIKVHNNERDFPCSECDKAFTNKYDLLRHLNLHEAKKHRENGTFDGSKVPEKTTHALSQCELCGKCCRNISDLKRHIRVHTGERPFDCPHCEKTFKSTSALNCHVRIHTQDKPYVCKSCGKGFAQSSNLRTHETIHASIKPFSCDLCSRYFNRKRDLMRHLEKCLKKSDLSDSDDT